MANRKAVEVTEPEVIDIPLLEECIIVTGGEEMARESKSLPFKQVDWLKLSFKNIVRIENLVGFVALQKLQLDNNHIRKIENLDHLTNLTWLDLSFNQIVKIEGIDTLTKLTDLCLTHNEIKKLEGISNLENLEIFSCANNEISLTDELQTLRKFERLRVVNFQNNPVCKDPEYQPVLLAFLKHLKYLDFRLVDDAKVQSAKEQYFSDLQQLTIDEAQEAQAKKREEEEAETNALYARANMPGVETLFKTMQAEDMEGEKLKLFSEFEDPLADFQDDFKDAWESFKVAMLDLYDQKVDEKKKFDLNYFGAIEAVDQQSKKMIADYKMLKKRTNTKLEEGTSGPEREELLSELHGRTEELREHLLELEMFQVEQYEDLIMQFEDKYGSIRSKTLDETRQFFEKMRDMQNVYFEKVQERAKDLLTKYAAGEVLNLPDEAQQVLADKDAFMTGVVTGSHEFKISKIDGKDEEITKRENANYSSMVDSILAAEKERSRTRTDDVLSMIEFFQREIDQL